MPGIREAHVMLLQGCSFVYTFTLVYEQGRIVREVQNAVVRSEDLDLDLDCYTAIIVI
jgi:hypothetical protein